MSTTIYTTNEVDAPNINGNASVIPGITYGVTAMLMMGDLDSKSEYVDISIDGKYTGRCADNTTVLNSGSCEWYACSGLSDLNASSSLMDIRLQYSYGYHYNYSGPCQINSTLGIYAAAIITLTPKGSFSS